MRCGVGVVSPGVVSAPPRSHRRRRHVRRCCSRRGAGTGSDGRLRSFVQPPRAVVREGASRWFAGLLTDMIKIIYG